MARRGGAGVAVSFSGEIHPAAAVWPPLPEEDLRRLAESIRAKGLLNPIELDPQGRLVDGRNRLAACQLAGVEPRFVVVDDDSLVRRLRSVVDGRTV